MIVKDSDAIKRLTSPMNLINKLRENSPRKSAMSLFIPNKKQEVLSESGKPVLSSDKAGVEHPAKNTSSFNPFKPNEPLTAIIPAAPVLENILENSESQIKLGLAHDRALDLLNRSVDMLSTKLEDVKADKLPSVIAAASRTVESIRKERSEQSKNNKDRDVHFHFYTPEQKKVSDYEVIDVA